MTAIAELVCALSLNRESRVVIAVAAYPRDGWTGELAKIDQLLSRVLSLLTAHGGRSFRIMHGQGVALMEGVDAASIVQDAIASCVAPEVEVRALIVHVTGSRNAEWLDDLLGDLSVRGNFGRFSQEHVTRLKDGRLVSRAPESNQ